MPASELAFLLRQCFLFRSRRAAPLLLAWLAWQVRCCQGMSWLGELPFEKDGQRGSFSEYVGKFCFDYRVNITEPVGMVYIRTYRDGPLPSGDVKFMVFDDEPQHWMHIRRNWKTSSCAEKAAAASYVANIFEVNNKQETMYSIQIRQTHRPRFWYLTFVACGASSTVPVTYKVHTMNEFMSWQKEFSLDHAGLLPLYACLSVAFLVTLLATTWATRWRAGSPLLRLRDHPYFHLLLLAHCASSASSVCFLVHYAIFMKDGMGAKRIRFLGVLAGTVANCTIFLLAILSSIGWAITIFVLRGRRCFLAGVALVGGIGAVAELRSEITLDESTKLYAYQSAPGKLAMLIKIFMFCWFGYQIKQTHEAELTNHQARRYFKVLGVCFTVWSLNVPVVVLLAELVDPWVRYKVVTSVDVLSRFVGQALLSMILCGSWSPVTESNTFVVHDDDEMAKAKFIELT